MKTSAQTHNELYVWPRRHQVEEGADHAPVLPLVHWFSILVRIQSSRTPHGCRHRLHILHMELPQHVFRVLGLMYKCSVLHLLDLQPEKVLQLAHHAHLKFPTHLICKLGNKVM
jgi:hypothetical protein